MILEEESRDIFIHGKFPVEGFDQLYQGVDTPCNPRAAGLVVFETPTRIDLTVMQKDLHNSRGLTIATQLGLAASTQSIRPIDVACTATGGVAILIGDNVCYGFTELTPVLKEKANPLRKPPPTGGPLPEPSSYLVYCTAKVLETFTLQPILYQYRLERYLCAPVF